MLQVAPSNSPDCMLWAPGVLGEEVFFWNGDGIEHVRTCDALPTSLKLLLLYFSGRWCPVCQEFDPQLIVAYHGLKALPEGSDFELVWISCDASDRAYQEHFQSLAAGVMGTILAVAWSIPLLDSISLHYKVEGMPTLLVVDALQGKVINNTGRDDILACLACLTEPAMPATPMSASWSASSHRPQFDHLIASWMEQRRKKQHEWILNE